MTDWYSISVSVGPEAAEAIEYALNSLDSLGTEINHLQKTNSDIVTVVGYFNEMPDEERVQDELHYALRIYGFDQDAVRSLERSEVANTDWLAEWKKHWKPTRIGKFVIAPPWSEVTDGDDIVIRIEPNMAFGTGTHETTQLCLQAIEQHFTPGYSFLDVGTGTGILAIAAAKMNGGSGTARGRIYACDTDTDSVALAAENAERNDVGGMIDFSVGSISESTDNFDFVCANLTLDVIEPIVELLTKKAGKTLVMSGILAEQRPQIEKALSDVGINDVTIAQSGEWISVVVNFA